MSHHRSLPSIHLVGVDVKVPNSRDSAELFNDSLERIKTIPGFFIRFHTLFLASSGEVREKFENTALTRQVDLLRTAFYYILLASRGDHAARALLEPVAMRHSRHALNIRPELYNLWLDSLIRAVAECDPRFSPEVEQAWRVTMESGIRFMMNHY